MTERTADDGNDHENLDLGVSTECENNSQPFAGGDSRDDPYRTGAEFAVVDPADVIDPHPFDAFNAEEPIDLLTQWGQYRYAVLVDAVTGSRCVPGPIPSTDSGHRR